MREDQARTFRPVAPPRVLENAYTQDQHRRLVRVVREHGPWKLILAHHFKAPEEVVATTSGELPEGLKPTWEMFLTPVFRGYLAQGGVCLYREIEDCYYNSAFLEQVRSYWGARYAEPESMLFNIQGPCGMGGAPHLDATRFRGITMENSPVWLMNIMAKSGLFTHWRAKKAQIIAWYYRGRIGGGFCYWPDGPRGAFQRIRAPMWGRAVVVENEMMYHTAEACGARALRRPAGLSIDSVFAPDPERSDGWRITTGNRVVQRLPAEEVRFLVHWGAQLYMDYEELKLAKDHTDDLTHERVFDTFSADLRARGASFEVPSDPLTDKAFIRTLTHVYDLGTPGVLPPEPEDESIAA
jgi:hypothetical protein